MTEAIAIDHGIALSRDAFAVGWRGVYGPAVAVLSSPSAVAPSGAMHLPGAARAAGAAAPALAPWGRRIAAAWVSGAGGELCLVDAGGASAARPVPVHEGARAVAVATVDGRLVVAGVDGSGIALSWFDRADEPRPLETRRVVEAADVGDRLCIVSADPGLLVLYLTHGGERLGVVHVDPDPDVSPRDVRHPLPGPVTSLHAMGVRGLRAVTLCYGGGRAGQVDLAVLDTRGVMRERPHAVLTERSGRLTDAHPLWIETGIVVAALDEAAGQLRIEPTVDTVDAGASVRAERGPARMAWWRRRLLVTRLLAEGDRVELAVRRMDEHGDNDGVSRVEVTPPDTARLGRRARATALLESVQAGLAGRGYRDGGTVARTSPDGLELVVGAPVGPARVRFDPRRAPLRLELVASEEGAEAPAEVAPPPSLVRLARWVRERISRRAAAAARAEHEWAREVFGGTGEVQRIDGAGPALAVVVHLTEFPDPRTVLEWLRAMRARLVARRGDEEVADGPGSA